jgi:hypothetical protein
MLGFQVVAVRVPVLRSGIVPKRGRMKEEVRRATLVVVHGGSSRGPRSVLGTVGCRRVCQGRRGGCLSRAGSASCACGPGREALGQVRPSPLLEKYPQRHGERHGRLGRDVWGSRSPAGVRTVVFLNIVHFDWSKCITVGCMAMGSGVQDNGLQLSGLHCNGLHQQDLAQWAARRWAAG